MVRTLAALALALVACSKGSTTTVQTTPSNKAEPHAAVPALDDPLAYLPVESDFVVGVEWSTVRESALYRTFEPEIIDGLGERLDEVRRQCGFDPITSIQRVGIGGKIGVGAGFVGVIVVRGVAGDSALECLRKADEGNAKLANGVLTIEQPRQKTIATIVGGSTLVMHIDENASAETLAGVIRKGAPLRGSPAFMDMFNRREANAAAWGMINGNSELLAFAGQLGAKPKSIDGTLVLDDAFNAYVRVTYATPTDADNINKQLQQVLPMVTSKIKVEKLDVRADGSVVRADVRASDAQVRMILSLLGGFI